MTTFIIISIVLAGLILHFSIGAIAALKLAPKIAEISMKPTNGSGLLEYEWSNGYPRESDSYRTVWYSYPWQPKDIDRWNETGRTRKQEPDEIVFNQNSFRSTMTLIRWFWFLGVPAVLNASVDKKMIEKYDPAVAERKQKALEAKIADLEKELLDD